VSKPTSAHLSSANRRSRAAVAARNRQGRRTRRTRWRGRTWLNARPLRGESAWERRQIKVAPLASPLSNEGISFRPSLPFLPVFSARVEVVASPRALLLLTYPKIIAVIFRQNAPPASSQQPAASGQQPAATVERDLHSFEGADAVTTTIVERDVKLGNVDFCRNGNGWSVGGTQCVPPDDPRARNS